MPNYNKAASLVLRYGLAATYIYSGLSLILQPSAWRAYVPFWFADLLPIDVLTYLQIQGGSEILLALAFITGILIRPAAFISSVEMILILLLFGFDGVTFRDLAILGGSLAVFLQTFAYPPKAPTPIVTTAPPSNLTDSQKRFRIFLVVSAFVLFSIILIGLLWLSNTTKDQAGWLTFSYATGLSMIVLPCTLPLAFVIVPLAMGKNPKKGLAIAVAFALGVTITLSFYGAIIAYLGQVVGLDRAKNLMYTVAGVFAVVFGMAELGLLKVKLPTYSGAFPKFIQERKDIGKGFLLGLLLGNVGLGCPNPAFYVLLSHIATVGSMSTGWFLTFIHAIGRVTPLLLLAILAVLGVDALSTLMKRKDFISRITAWGVIGVGGFILAFGLLGHDWYVYSGIHSLLEVVTREASFMTSYADKFGGIAHTHEIPTGPYLKYGSWLMVSVIVIPLFWVWRRQYKGVGATDVEKRKTLHWMGAFVLAISLFLYVFFGMYLPTWVRSELGHHDMSGSMSDHAHEPGIPDDHEHPAGTPGDHGHMDAGAMMAPDVEILMNTDRPLINPGQRVNLEFLVQDKQTRQPITNLEISHGEPMHLVGMRKEDLQFFTHTHPVLQTDRYVINHTFAEAGTYVFWTGIVINGAHITQQMPQITVGSPSGLKVNPVFNKNMQITDDLVMTFKTPPVVRAGENTIMAFAITDSGGFDLPLGKYLEENMHINVVSANLVRYHHLHTNYGVIGGEDHGAHQHSQLPVESGFSLIPVAYAQDGHDHSMHDHGDGGGTTTVNSITVLPKDLAFQLNFAEPGLYKIFGEFVLTSDPDQIYLGEFFVQVEPPAPAGLGSSGSLPKWLLLVISVVLIGGVLPFIFRYLNEDKIKV